MFKNVERTVIDVCACVCIQIHKFMHEDDIWTKSKNKAFIIQALLFQIHVFVFTDKT